MNNEFQKNNRSKPRFIFEDDCDLDFIKTEFVINEELEITPVIDLDAVKTEQEEPNQSEKNDLNFPIETQLHFPIENQANVLTTSARNKAKITKHYATSTNKNSDNLTVPELIENSLPNETQPVKIKIETIELIDVKEHNITFEPIAEVDVKENIIFEPFEGLDIKEKIVKTEDNVVKQPHLIKHIIAKPMPKTAQKPGRKRLKHTCIFCDKKFTTKYKMQEHIRTHNGKKPSCKCVHRSLNVHVIAPGGVPFACNLCKLVTCTRADLKRHMVKFHDMKAEVYKCHHCQSSFSHKDHLIAHLKLQSDDYTSHYKCSKYKFVKGFKYDYDTCLTKGERNFIDNYEIQSQSYECGTCPFKCTKQLHLKAHISKHKAVLAKKSVPLEKHYLCHFCKFKSTKVRDLNQHLKKIHQESKPYFCKLCDCKYSKINELVSHIKDHLTRKK